MEKLDKYIDALLASIEARDALIAVLQQQVSHLEQEIALYRTLEVSVWSEISSSGSTESDDLRSANGITPPKNGQNAGVRQ